MTVNEIERIAFFLFYAFIHLSLSWRLKYQIRVAFLFFCTFLRKIFQQLYFLLIYLLQFDDKVFQKVGVKVRLRTDIEMYQDRFIGGIYGCRWLVIGL